MAVARNSMSLRSSYFRRGLCTDLVSWGFVGFVLSVFGGAVDKGSRASVIRSFRSLSNLDKDSAQSGSVGLTFWAASHRAAANDLNFCFDSSVNSLARSFSSARQAEESSPSYAGASGLGGFCRLGGGGPNIFSLSKWATTNLWSAVLECVKLLCLRMPALSSAGRR